MLPFSLCEVFTKLDEKVMYMLKEKKRKIILIEDDSDHAELIVDVLQDEDIQNEIVLLKDGQEAVNFFENIDISQRRVQSSQIDLVLLDINLPKIQGQGVLKLIKNSPEFCSIPVVVLTTSGESQTIERVYKCGANGYVIKPISYDGFVEKMRMVKEYWLNTEKLSIKKDAKKGRILLADDDDVFLQVTSHLLQSEGYECLSATDAKTVIEKLKSSHYDLLISDINMPGNKELELIKYLQEVGEVIPVILATGNPAIHSSIQSLHYPVLAYMFKPFAVDKFLAQVEISVERYRGRIKKMREYEVY